MNSKNAVITGASRGIGRAIALLFSKNGYNVVINYKSNDEKAAQLKNEIEQNGGIAEIFKADIGNYDEAKGLIDFCTEKFGQLDVLVNNAGIAQIKLFTDITQAEWSEMIKTNLTGVFNCSQLATRQMLKEHSGSIINISSMWGQVGASCEVHYSTVKAGIIGLTKALAKELAPSNIRVNCIAPGVIDTDMMRGFTEDELTDIKNDIPLGRLGTPNDIAELALFLASEKAGYITGQIIGSNGGYVI
ncbi:MAG: SDR family oxidoreductase [Clostridia bacterium]|nr:SDR family oxidoreductase [Clostridia bacterium]